MNEELGYNNDTTTINESEYSDTPCNIYLTEVEHNGSDLNIDKYLTLCMAEKNLPFNYLIPLTIINCLMFITGISGNVLVCYIIAKNTSMHTSTNFFLFSLAISDITILFVGLPNDLYVYWQQYPWIFGVGLCKIRALVSEMTSYSSVLTIVAFSMERFVPFFPLKRQL